MNNIQWQRPKTTRMYLHPPKAERMYTIWREGKIIFGEIEISKNIGYFDLTSAGMWFYSGENREQFDFHDTKIIHREDGIPVHGLGLKLGDLDLNIEAFSDFGRTPVCYIKVRIENNSVTKHCEKFGFMLRTGKECELVFSSPDVYDFYAPDISVWQGMESTWSCTDGTYTDGIRTIKAVGNIPFKFCDGCADAVIELEPGKSCETVFAFNIGDVPAFDYETSKARAIDLWMNELSAINKISDNICCNTPVFRTIQNLTVQLLQCFCYPKGENFMLARQGGLQRQIWTYETMSVLEALSKLGDFDDYIEPIIDTYFNDFAVESGEIVPLAIPWAMATGNVLYSFGKYAMERGDKAFFCKYADAAYRAFKWLNETRRSTKEAPGVVAGLFPPKSACDDQLVFQSWCSTDTFNLRGLKAFAESCEMFGDSRANEVKAEYDEYLGVMLGAWESIKAEQSGELLKVPYSPAVPDELITENFAFSSFVAYFVEGLDLDEDDALKMFDSYTKLGMIKEDGTLTNRMPDKKEYVRSSRCNGDENGKCIAWYVCCHEYYWFMYFLRHGMRDRCEKLISGAEKYAMTDEYYMIERYNVRNPYFAPWSPNASANGRMINMLIDFYS